APPCRRPAPGGPRPRPPRLSFAPPAAPRTRPPSRGAFLERGREDVDPAVIGHAKVTYLEGYLWDPPRAKQAFIKAAEIARRAGHKVALTLSDPFCVDRHRAEFQQLVEKHVDILFANEHEICSLWQTDRFDQALQA